MKAVTLLVLLFSHQGYWIGGQDQTVAVAWATKDPAPPAADLVWELGSNALKLAGGTVPLEAGAGGPAALTIKAPQVRVRTTLRWGYRLVQRDGGKILEAGERAVHVFPADLSADWPGRVGGRKLLVWDAADGPLAKALSAAKVPFARADDLSNVFERPDLILVAADRVGESAFAQDALANLAAAGASVAVFEQRRPARLAGYPLARRAPPAEMRLRAGHPLLDRFEPADLQAWTAAAAIEPPTAATTRPAETRPAAELRPVADLRAVQLPADEPALELAWWPPESPGRQPAPIDALLVTKATGVGRLVLCQIPLGPWDADPRSQLFLGNLLSYLTTRPEPTPPPSARAEEAPRPAPQTIPTIDFSPGAKP